MTTVIATFEPHKPPIDWNYWGRIATASLDQAITLSQDLCPEQFCGLRINPDLNEFLTRRAVVLNRMGCEVSDLAPAAAFGLFPAPLVDVGVTLMEAGFTLPERYPRPAGSQSQELPIPGADWTLWAHMPKSTLREAVLLSLDLEPKPPVLTFTQHETPKRYAEPGREYDRRLSIASAHIDAAGPLRPLGHLPLLNGPAGATVSLGEFAAWAIGIGWELPELFPRATAPAQTPAPVVTAPVELAADAPVPMADVPAKTPAPMPAWQLIPPPKRLPGYRWQLYQYLEAAHKAGKPRPTARDVLLAWQANPPDGLSVSGTRVLTLNYIIQTGDLKNADKKAIQTGIDSLILSI